MPRIPCAGSSQNNTLRNISKQLIDLKCGLLYLTAMNSQPNQKNGILTTNRNISALFVAAVGLGLIAVSTAKGGVVYDNISSIENSTPGTAIITTSSTPNTFVGDGFNLAAGTTEITGFDVVPVNHTGTTFTSLKVTGYIWGTVNTGTVNASHPAFGNLLDTVSFTNSGSFSSGNYYALEGSPAGANPGFTLATPVAITGTSIGITLNFEGSTDGINFNNLNNLSPGVSSGALPTVGSDMFNGFYRNVNSEVNGDFTSTLRSIAGSTDETLALRIYGGAVPAPEPATLALVGVGSLVLLRLRRRAA